MILIFLVLCHSFVNVLLTVKTLTFTFTFVEKEGKSLRFIMTRVVISLSPGVKVILVLRSHVQHQKQVLMTTSPFLWRVQLPMIRKRPKVRNPTLEACVHVLLVKEKWAHRERVLQSPATRVSNSLLGPVT